MLVAERLVKAYRGARVVEEVSLVLRPGSIVGLVGANGAGKSSTIKMLAGLIEPTEGTVLLDGEATTTPETRRRIGYLPEDSPLYEELDPLRLFRFFGSLYGVPAKEAERRGKTILTRLDLKEAHWKKPVGNMSKGMRRKVAVALALLHDPAVVVFDEPTSGLDPVTVQEMGAFFLELRDQGKAILLSAHNLPQVEQVCDEIIIMHNGHAVAQGSLAELRDEWGTRSYRVRATVAMPNSTARGTVHEAEYVDWSEVDTAMKTVQDSGGSVLEVEAVPPRLDEILLNVTSR